eukprot:Gb_09885 [translate_table: standard]
MWLEHEGITPSLGLELLKILPGSNIFDTIVVVISAGSLFFGTYPSISSARIVRWFYQNNDDNKDSSIVVGYLSIHEFADYQAKCIQGLGALSSVAFFYLLVIFVFAIMGMELYAGEYSDFTDGYPRANFDSLFNAMLTWFTVTTGENWINNMWNAMRSGDEFIKFLKQRKSFGATRGGTWVIGAVEGAQAGIKGLAKRMNTMRVATLSTHGKTLRSLGTPQIPLEAVNQQMPDAISNSMSISHQYGDARQSLTMETGNEPSHEGLTNQLRLNKPTKRASQIIQSAGFPMNISEKGERGTALRNSVISLVHQQNLVTQSAPTKQLEFIDGTMESSSTVMSVRNRASFVLAEFEGLMNIHKPEAVPWFHLLMVAITVYLLSMTDAKGEFIKAPTILHILDCLTIAVFGIDLLLKCVSYGVLLTPQPFLGNLYNMVDLFILTTDIVGFFQWDDTTARSLRIVHAFRPLRLICRLRGIEKLVNNLIQTLPVIASVFAFTMMIISVFGIVGIQLFRGMLKYCNDGAVTNRVGCVGTYINDSGILSPRIWQSPKFNFDNMGNAVLSLYVVSTFDNWVTNQLYPVMDIRHKHEHPSLNSHPLYSLYFIAFICVGGYFVMHMFIGVLVDQFGMMSGSKLLTERQKLWRDTNRIIQHLKPLHVPTEPKNPIQKKIYSLVTSPYYGKFASITVILNYVFLAAHYSDQTTHVTWIRRSVGAGFLIIYTLDLCLMFIGLGVMSSLSLLK